MMVNTMATMQILKKNCTDRRTFKNFGKLAWERIIGKFLSIPRTNISVATRHFTVKSYKLQYIHPVCKPDKDLSVPPTYELL